MRPARDLEADRATIRAVLEEAQSGNHTRAAALAEAALAAGLEHPLLLNVAAIQLEHQGRWSAALALLQRAVQIAPSDVASRNALGLCLMQLERPAEAFEQFETLLKSGAELAFVHTSRGTALLALGTLGEAEASFRRALDLDARQSLAWAGLAQIATIRGDYPQARASAQKALALLPGLPRAVMALASAELHESLAPEAEERIRALLEDSRLQLSERAHASGVLGDALDAQNRTNEAFAAYSTCNEELRRLYAGRYAGPADALGYVQAVMRHFEHAPAGWKSRPPPGPDFSGVRGHVFILGFPRSGTTLLEVILEGHPHVVSLEEHELLIDSLPFMQSPEDLERLLRASPATLEQARAAYWRRAAESGAAVAGKVFVDKYPLNSLKLPLISRLFPAAKILLACRDPRDTVLSCFRHRFPMSAPAYQLLSLEGAARYYDAVMRLIVRCNAALTLDTCLVRHEDLVTEFAREIRRICAFLGLQWVPAMGDFALRTAGPPEPTRNASQLVRGLDTEGIGQWRRYRAQLATVLGTLEPWITRFYYDPD